MAIPGATSTSSSSENTNQSYPFAFSALTMLFFMWGFLTSMNDILIPHLKGIFELSYFQASLIQFTFFSAYFIMSIPSGKLVSMLGYQKGIVVGLATAGVGAFLFYPAAVLPSYPVFLTALFILASGITVLQVAANPYVSVLGPSETSSARLNLSQAFNSLGTTIAPYLGGIFILSSVIVSSEELASYSMEQLNAFKVAEAATVQMPYVLLGLTLFVLAAIFLFLNLPVIDGMEEDKDSGYTFGDALAFSHLKLGMIGIFVYVGAEVSIGSYLVNFLGLDSVASLVERDAAKWVSYYWGGAMVGRFIGSALMAKFRAETLLGISSIAAAVLVLISTLSSGSVAMFSVLSVGLFNSIMFPTIFTLAIKGLGKLTGRGSSLLIMSIVGGAILPAIMGAMADTIGLKIAYLLPVLCYAYIAFYGFKGSQMKSLGKARVADGVKK